MRGVEVGEPVDPLVAGQLLVIAAVGSHPEQLSMTRLRRRLFRVVIDPHAVVGELRKVEVHGLVVGEEVLAARRGDRG
jgi:DNA-binding MarR family transcriptional regulator